jgi:hypothetical protein
MPFAGREITRDLCTSNLSCREVTPLHTQTTNRHITPVRPVGQIWSDYLLEIPAAICQ